MDILKDISIKLQEGDFQAVEDLTNQALKSGIESRDILNLGLLDGMNVIGQQFKKREIFLPDVLMAAKAMQKGVDVIKPLLAAGNTMSGQGTIVIGTVKGDLHDIGKNLVVIMLKGAGYEVIDLGYDVPAEKFVGAVTEHQADILGLSALLTTTMPEMKKVIEAMKEKEISVKILVGGAPVTAEFAEEIGADAYGYDGTQSVELVKRIMGNKNE